MSGHSKWSTIKRAKAATDAKRSAIFTKLANVITIAARDKGGDMDTNFALRMAVDKAKVANMPKANIEKAIKRGTGELEGGQIEELVYEAIGPANSQFVVKVLTDNKNRSAASIRHVFTKHGGSLGAVMWNFEQKGVIRINKDEIKEKNITIDEFELEVIDKGAEDIENEEEGITIYTQINDLKDLKTFLEEKNINTESADIEYVANEDITPTKEEQEKIDKITDELEENEDVSDYYSNIN